MPYDREHGVLNWGGTLPGGEIWSSTLRMAETEETILGANDTADWADEMQGYLDHYTGILQAHHADANSMIHANCKLTYVKFNRVDIDGKYVDPNTYRNDFAPIGGGRSANQHPNQITMVVTWTTAVSRGPASKGRLYVPLPGIALEADGRIAVGAATDAVARYKSLVENLSDVPGPDTSGSPGAVVMSKVGTGVRTRRIDGVRVGRVLDTQRRRRNNQVEDYQEDDVDQGGF